MTNKEYELYLAIKNYLRTYNYSPSVRELCKLVNNTSTATVHQKLHQLKRKGYIDFVDGISRTITIKNVDI